MMVAERSSTKFLALYNGNVQLDPPVWWLLPEWFHHGPLGKLCGPYLKIDSSLSVALSGNDRITRIGFHTLCIEGEDGSHAEFPCWRPHYPQAPEINRYVT